MSVASGNSDSSRGARLRLLLVGLGDEVAHHLGSDTQPADLTLAASRGDLERALVVGGWDCILCAPAIGETKALDVVRRVRAHDATVPVVAVAGALDARAAVELIRAGASDWVDARDWPGLDGIVAAAIGAARIESDLLVERELLGDELERAGRVKTGFVQTVSHELRTPLNTLIGYADLLAEGAFGAPSDEQREILGRISQRARALLELLLATLDLPGLEERRVVLDVRHFSLVDLLAELRDETAGWPRRSDLEVNWEIAADLPEIDSDAAKLRVVLRNLVANALKFTDRGTVRVTAAEHRDGVELRVADSGIGISAAQIDNVFDAFWQADSSSTRTHGGVGLGLYIARRLVEMLDGRIEVESEVGAGTTFHVFLPLRPGSGRHAPG
jgi:signal transduction histidine kinase